MEQEEKVEIAKLDQDFESRIFAANPELWQELYGGDLPAEPIDDEGVLFPTNEEEFKIMLDQFASEGWTG